MNRRLTKQTWNQGEMLVFLTPQSARVKAQPWNNLIKCLIGD